MSPRRLLLVAGVAVLVFAFDRVTKIWVEQNIPLHEGRDVVGEYVRIVHTQNTGAAFGLLPERTTLLSVLSVVAVLAIVYYYRQFANSSPLVTVTLGMQLGGAFGNLLDRAPGRTIKFGLVAYVPIALAIGGAPIGIAIAPVMGAAFGLLGDDLRERVMLGDTGANVIGAVLGLAVVLGSRDSIRLAVMLTLLASAPPVRLTGNRRSARRS